MTQANTPAPPIAWSQAFQLKLMAALDAAWAILEHSSDPMTIKRVREKAKACGDLAAMVRKVAQIVPAPRATSKSAQAAVANVIGLTPVLETVAETALAPVAAQAEHARRALEKLKGGRRGRI